MLERQLLFTPSVLAPSRSNEPDPQQFHGLDLGLEPFLITATIEGIISQRLVRKICKNCKTTYEPTEEALAELGLRLEDVKGKSFYYGKGCDQCNNTGYRGRTGIFEIMTFTDSIR